MLQENDNNSTSNQAPLPTQSTTNEAGQAPTSIQMTPKGFAKMMKIVAAELNSKPKAKPTATPSPPTVATAHQTPVDLTKGQSGSSPKKARTDSGTKTTTIGIDWSILGYEDGKSILEFFDAPNENHFSDDTVQFSRETTPIWCSNRLRDYYEVFDFAETTTRKDQCSTLITQTHNLKIAHYKLGHYPQLNSVANLVQYHFAKYRLESGIGYYTLIMTILTELPIAKRYNNKLQACYLSEKDVYYILNFMYNKLTGPKKIELLGAIKRVELNVKNKYTSPFANTRTVPE
jgi:hypothetical protein